MAGIGMNWFEWLEIAGNIWKLLEIFGNCWKYLEMSGNSRNCLKCMEMDGNGAQPSGPCILNIALWEPS